MAKLKKRSKISQHRHKSNKLVNPKTSNTEIKPLDSQISELFDQLNSQDVETRHKGLASLTLLCDADPSIRKLALKNNLIKIVLSSHVTDSDFTIRSAALGLLRNLVIEEEYDMAIHLWRSDIWVVLENGFQSVTTSEGIQFEYLDSLIGLLDALCMELTIEIVNDQIIPKLSEKNIMKLLFEALNIYITSVSISNAATTTVISILQLFFDISSISTVFLQALATEFNYMQASGPLFTKLDQTANLGKIYIIGTNFQICEFNDDLGNGQVNQVVVELFNIVNGIDINKTIEYLNNLANTPNSNETDPIMKTNFQIIDATLDLFTTMIEYTGFTMESKGIKSDKFTELVVSQIIPFTSQLITNNFKNGKTLVCLNNAFVYLSSLESLSDDKIQSIGEHFLKINEVLTIEFVSSIDSIDEKTSSFTIEHLCDLVSFKFNLIDFASSRSIESRNSIIQKDSSLGLIPALIKLSTKLLNYELLDDEDDRDIDILIQYTSTLVPYLTVIAKYAENDELTKVISQYLVDQLLIQPVTFYKTKLTPTESVESTTESVVDVDKKKKKKGKKGGKMTTAKYHNQYGYIVESTLNEAINSIFELFDDDYSYNREIYHNGGLHQVLGGILPEYKLIYKNIDKNQQIGLKKRSEDTLMNLGRFIIYKETETS